MASALDVLKQHSHFYSSCSSSCVNGVQPIISGQQAKGLEPMWEKKQNCPLKQGENGSQPMHLEVCGMVFYAEQCDAKLLIRIKLLFSYGV